MRSEQEMLELILTVAKGDDRIRAVYMNGSRANPKVKKDILQDYDIVYVVTETGLFIGDEAWIQVFGELIMIQEPDRMDLAAGLEVDVSRSYSYLMLFTDGNRIDLHIETKEAMLEQYGKDSLTIPLLDKDGILLEIPFASDDSYHIKEPTAIRYFHVCNEFWWCQQNVAKGIWRKEIPYAKNMAETIVRPMLDEMVSWWIGMKHHFQVSSGKMGKYFHELLPEEYWNMYRQTYGDSREENMWQSLFMMNDLFRLLGEEVAKQQNLSYPAEDDIKMTKFLKRLRSMPIHAENIF
ncbi:aminoglycoside 6-adenylyltransferase [Niallia taxi]|uniref:Aminoglycoside 6-adenylyltransferase n=1 Tax=Niallia taxi TaxID=2499688 RepID=A0A3S2TS02_9BACI|nr:aminoglycoside 6-adenylyltransferase [Niallia taxi]MCM3217508.1 aminoglycoside 6-adenylyltransferase [Niallia taxi]MDK8642948.1 aminoglycoside 6-adenylyltransferase [Niallia taxi]MED4054314.1 aminoglycoside 6-adenylyltransferase [Niallia taxi]MED4120411.1 aminoglycoside 6-adenylyltransferase [Niallia taxi]RVT58616.1 aminoglycoside 6-adenylyltransferase [Niallia taxi]